MRINVTACEKDANGKVADAELVFEASDGVLSGLRLIGFSVWTQRGRAGHYNVTFPARQYSVNGERRAFALLRPVADGLASVAVRDAIIAAYHASLEPQERLPVAGVVRDEDKPTPTFDAPFALTREASSVPDASARRLFT